MSLLALVGLFGTFQADAFQPDAVIVAQSASDIAVPEQNAGTYSNGFRYVQVAQRAERICVAAFFDEAGQAVALEEALSQVRQEAESAEAELEQLLEQEISERRQGILALLADDELLSQAIAAEQLTAEQVEQIEGFRGNPDALNQFLTEQGEATLQSAKAEIQQRRIAIEDDLTATAEEAASFQTFQGLASLAPAASLDVLTTDTADILVMPQDNGLLIVGEPNRLVSYIPVEEIPAETPTFLDSEDMQACLSAEEPFRVDFE